VSIQFLFLSLYKENTTKGKNKDTSLKNPYINVGTRLPYTQWLY
jgi:hypothetical protein